MKNGLVWARTGAILAALAIVTGAFGAHSLRNILDPSMLSVYEKAVHYHAYHALGLFAVALVGEMRANAALVKWAGRMMVFGILMFSGSLYGLSLTGIGWLGALTPIGGLLFISAWMLLFMALRNR